VNNRIVKRVQDTAFGSKSLIPAKKHHFIVGGGFAALLVSALVLLVSGKSRQAQAGSTAPIEIKMPTMEPQIMPELPAIGATLLRDIPKSDVIYHPLVTVSLRDGIPVSAAAGIFKRPTVQLTRDLAVFAKSLSQYFAQNHMQAMITSGVRTGDRQLEIIKDRIQQYGMAADFPGIRSATVRDKNIWEPAWEWLKARHVPVNPPTDYIDEEGNKIGGSLHLKGLAVDLVSNNLDALKSAIASFTESKAAKSSPLQITGLVRERDCVHISLSK
jgi:hypothetical protein